MSLRAEIGDGLDARARGDYCGFADLQRARDFAAEEFDGVAFVEDGLAVRTDEFDGFERNAGLPKRFGEQLAEQEVQTRDRRRVGRRVGNCEDGFANFWRIRHSGRRKTWMHSIHVYRHRCRTTATSIAIYRRRR